MGLLDFKGATKILIAVRLKHSSFWPSGVVDPLSNDIVNSMPWQCMFALSMGVTS